MSRSGFHVLEAMAGRSKSGRGPLLLGLTGVALAVELTRRWLLTTWRASRQRLSPKADGGGGGEVKSIEKFGEYVVRQLGLAGGGSVAAAVAQAADDYVRGDKTAADKSREQVLLLAASACAEVSQEESARLVRDFVEELDACMLTYFAFHWKHAGIMVEQIIKGPKRKYSFKDAVLIATRAQRFKKVLDHLGPQRKLSVLLEEMKMLHQNNKGGSGIPTEGEVMVPADDSVRCPVLLMLGGGMGAGKSTVAGEVMKTPFWSKIAQTAVIVEADAFKEKDVVYKALLEQSAGDVASVAQMVHDESTAAASSMLVTALNEGRDVIFDGTMSWEPFVAQTIAMARNVHKVRYRLGPGYRKLPDGTVQEQYWEQVGEGEEETAETSGNGHIVGGKEGRLPYRIEMVGVVCDAHLAVMRAMRRAILTKRGVPVGGQLRSHRLFAQSLERYSELVDKASIYNTDAMGRPPKLIAFKEGRSKLLVDRESYSDMKDLASLNTRADNALELVPREEGGGPLRSLQLFQSGYKTGRVWEMVVEAPERKVRQEALREAFQKLKPCRDVAAEDSLKQFITA